MKPSEWNYDEEPIEEGAGQMLIRLFDWQADFFKKRGFTVCSEIDYP